MGISKLTNICAAAAVALAAATAGAQLSKGVATKAIDRLNREYDQAMMKKNIAWFQGVYAPDYFMFDGKSKQTREEALNNLQHRAFEVMSIKGVTTKIDKIHPMKKGVYVVSTTTYHIQETGKPASNFPLQYEEYWTNTGGKWQVHYLKLLLQNAAPAPVKHGSGAPISHKKRH